MIFGNLKSRLFGILSVTLITQMGCGSLSTQRPVPKESKAVKKSATPKSAPKQAEVKPTTTDLGKLTDEPDYKALTRAYGAGQNNEVLAYASKLETRYSRGPDFVSLKNWKGLAYIADRKPALAIREFQRAIDENSLLPVLKPFLYYNLGTALTDNEQVEESLAILKDIDLSQAPPGMKVKILGLLGKNHLLKSQPVDAALATMKAASFIDNNSSSAPSKEASVLEIQLDRALALLNKREEFDRILNDSPSSFLTTKVEQRRLPLLALQNPATSVDSSPRSIGVLIPLSGRYAAIGTKVLKAITLGLGIFDKQSKYNFVIHVEDSGDTAEKALDGLNALVNQHKVALVLGPLLSKGIDMITLRAESLKVPLLTLSQYPGLPGEYIHSAGLTPQLQSFELARYAIEKLGIKRFAILQPKDKFGDQYAQSFWDAVEKLGGKITGFEKYQPGETDFRAPIDSLTGRAYPKARQAELDALEAKRKELNITKKTSKTAQYFELAPIVDFEGVFIPDNPETLGQVLPTFAYRDVDQIKFLGVSTWNSKSLLDRVYQQVEQTYFVDALYLDSSRPMAQRFISQFTKNENTSPTSLDAMAFDAALIAFEALKNVADQPTLARSQVNERIRNIRSIEGATGTLKYRDGAFQRSLEFLTVRKRQILPVDVALKSSDSR